MQPASAVNHLQEQINWHAINWQKAYCMLKNLRGRIFRAAKEGNLKMVRSLQKLMLRSYANVVTSIRRVTQLNKGKSTPGIDRITISTAEARADMARNLQKVKAWKAKPARRIYIRKENGAL